MKMSSSTSEPANDEAIRSTLQRLKSQQQWYSRQAGRSSLYFKLFKILALVAATAIPFLSGFGATLLGSLDGSALVIGLLGAVIVVIEGLQQLYQWHQNWINYRSTSEALKREQCLYTSQAGPYAELAEPHKLLAERIEMLSSLEGTKWLSSSNESERQHPPSRDTAG
jgi:hypothetical protein